MKFQKTGEAKFTIVYSKGKRIARFENGEFETNDDATIKCLNDLGYHPFETLKKRIAKVKD